MLHGRDRRRREIILVVISKSATLVNGFLYAGVLLLAKPYRRAKLAKMIRTALAL